MSQKKLTILDRLNAGDVIVGDGGLTHALEHRGYVTPGSFTPEAIVEYPHGVKEIHREFSLCGADVVEAFVFNGTDDNLNRSRKEDDRLDSKLINKAACEIAKEVAGENNCLVAGPISSTDSYANKLGKEKVQEEFQRQVDVFKDEEVDFLIAEFVGTIEEGEYAAEVMKKTGLPVAITLCIGPAGDFNNVPVEECGVRLAKAGADIVGINCRFEPETCVGTVKAMKAAIEKEGLKVHYICQPCGYRTFDCGQYGFIAAAECSLALEKRQITRWDAHKFARMAYDAGIRYIGGCCGFEPYHIRAIAEELHKERGYLPILSRGIAEGMKWHADEDARKRCTKEYWYNLVPGDGLSPEERFKTNIEPYRK